MALVLPPKFRNDIQGKDTALVPIVQIGNIIISTNSLPICKPLLLNIPSLKESIDIEKRNYKISSVNIDISNFPYDGQRFSELVDNSLINTPVNIYWTSPSDGLRGIGDLDGDGLITPLDYFDDRMSDFELLAQCLEDDECGEYGDIADVEGTGGLPNISSLTYLSDFLDGNTAPAGSLGFSVETIGGLLIYKGSVRRYDMTDEKVRLVVEDDSQATLHRDLPTAELGTGDDVPDKYKNKPIPMVYGHVDRSPCSLYGGHLIPDVNSDISYNTSTDSTTLKDISALYIFYDDKYINIPETVIESFNDSYMDSDGNEIEINYATGDSQYTEQDYIYQGFTIKALKLYNSELLSKELIQAQFFLKPSTLESNIVAPASPGEIYWLSMDNLTNIVDDSLQTEFTFVSENDESGGYYDIFGIRYGLDTNTKFYSFTTEGTLLVSYRSRLFINGIDITDNIGHPTSVISGGVVYMDTDNDGLYNDTTLGLFTTDIDEYNNGNRDFYIKWEGQIDETETWYLLSSLSEVVSTGAFFELRSLAGGFYIKDYAFGAMGIILQGSKTTIKFRIKSFDLWNYGNIEKPLNNYFYANVNGRGVGYMGQGLGYHYPDTSSVITDILDEVGYAGQIDYGTLPYDWEYAFTIDKKINSKKLIEGIASASPYIARFDNMGNFKFDVIQKSYDYTDTEGENQIIKEMDVIDFSFKRTPIEDVVTKIEFKYNWDYARGEFSSSRVLDIQDWACADLDGADTFLYYGLPVPELNVDGTWTHPESTLVIDDDRGKYIRDDDTAERFVCWMMSWYCNQHLIMKLKLPLKYMNLEIGDIVEFDELLGGISPFGINYKTGSVVGLPSFQTIYKYFMITETNKLIDYVQISCVQMHKLYDHTVDQTYE